MVAKKTLRRLERGDSGIYALILRLEAERELSVGALGEVCFPRGSYVYVGSAQQNLHARIRRHQSSVKKLHWHIDYLLQHAKIKGVRIFEGSRDKECELAQTIGAAYGARIVAKGFGSSDCGCPSHLFHLCSLDSVLLLHDAQVCDQHYCGLRESRTRKD